MISLDHLNPKQKEAVMEIDHHLLVVAGAGSGKTRVLTHKIAHIIESALAWPSQILAVTFSNKAAQEMKERVAHLISGHQQPYWIGTFHATALKILKEFHAHADLEKNFSIYDESDQMSVLKKTVADLNLDTNKTNPKTIKYLIDRAKNESIDFIHYIQNHFSVTPDIMEVIRNYQRILKSNNAMDFGDILIRCLKLLETNGDVKKQLQNRFTRILIDEYQDTNFIQKEIIKNITCAHTQVMAVGDEDQSIYAWRGARVENMLEFPNDFPDAKIIKLEQNYRSTQNILNVANAVIANNKGRREKNLWTQNPAGELVQFTQLDDDYQEARTTLDQIESSTQNTKLSDMAIFYRTHAQSRLLEEECRKRNIAYRVFGGMRFFDRKEIKDVLAFLKLLINPQDNVSFLRVINEPSRGIGKQSLAQLSEIAVSKNISMFQAIEFVHGQKKPELALRTFHEWINVQALDVEQQSVLEMTEQLLEKSGYMKNLEEENTIESSTRLDNIDELLRSMKEFESDQTNAVGAYLDHISLYTDTENQNDTGHMLSLMTVHNSKGLEFDAVWMVGMEEGLFPHSRSIEENDPDEIEEERRLCYVAMTRARKRLHLLSAQRRFMYRSTQYNQTSRFISEIPNRWLNTQFEIAQTRSGHGFKNKTFGKSRNYDEFSQISQNDDFDHMHNTPIQDQYRPGARVLHPKFGPGMIKNREGNSDNLKLTIQFKTSGLKKILLNYCQLEVLE